MSNDTSSLADRNAAAWDKQRLADEAKVAAAQNGTAK